MYLVAIVRVAAPHSHRKTSADRRATTADRRANATGKLRTHSTANVKGAGRTPKKQSLRHPSLLQEFSDASVFAQLGQARVHLQFSDGHIMVLGSLL